MAALAAETARYIEGLTIAQGEGAGEKFRLFPWERRFINGAIRPDVAEASPGAEVGIVASSFEQGGM